MLTATGIYRYWPCCAVPEMPVVAYHELQTDRYKVAGLGEGSCMHAC